MPGPGGVGDAGQGKGVAIGKRDGAAGACACLPRCDSDASAENIDEIGRRYSAADIEAGHANIVCLEADQCEIAGRAEERERVASSWGNVELQ